MPPVIDAQKCSGCGLCADICPLDVFYHEKAKTTPHVQHGDECWHCNACVMDCPCQAVELRIPLNYQILHVDAKQLHQERV